VDQVKAMKVFVRIYERSSFTLAADDLNLPRATLTHEMSFARDVANRVIFFDKGVIVEQGEAKALFANPKEERTRQFLSKFINN